MNDDRDRPSDRADLVFFGRISASATHEIKNVLATIGQQAGWIEDILLMTQAEGAVDMDRIRQITGKIANQVAKGDKIVRRLNRFAHSSDLLVTRFDLTATSRDLAAFAERLVGLKRVKFAVEIPDSEIVVTGDPFLCQRTVFGCIELLVSESKEGSSVAVSIADGQGSAVLAVTAEPFDETRSLAAHLSGLRALAGSLGATLDEASGQGRRVLTVTFSK
ncbi:MAG: HAMP domain-containing histidine kinase [Candidatus Riflebacteria bacterium]|nr:HAMP domain-containing histidine kinase [Candidatus Riflebacteria bacterium]